jgi:hypothetical protein
MRVEVDSIRAEVDSIRVEVDSIRVEADSMRVVVESIGNGNERRSWGRETSARMQRFSAGGALRSSAPLHGSRRDELRLHTVAVVVEVVFELGEEERRPQLPVQHDMEEALPRKAERGGLGALRFSARMGAPGRNARRAGVALLVATGALTGCGGRSELDVGPCVSPLEPTALPVVTFGGVAWGAGSSLVVTDDAVYYDVGIHIGTAQSAIARAALVAGEPDGSTPTQVAADTPFSFGPLAHDATNLYFPNAGVYTGKDPPPSMQIGHQEIVALPLAGGPIQTLDNPAKPTLFDITNVAGAPRGGVVWLLRGGGGMVLARWDGTATASLASFADSAFSVAASASEAFVMTTTALYAVPLAGGAASKLRDVPMGPDGYGQILGINDRSLFYSPEGATIVRRDLASGQERMLTDGLVLPWLHSGQTSWADATDLYVVTGPPYIPQKLWRMSVEGGASEVIWDSHDKPPAGPVVTDACNVYWLAASSPFPLDTSGGNGPSILMYRKK